LPISDRQPLPPQAEERQWSVQINLEATLDIPQSGADQGSRSGWPRLVVGFAADRRIYFDNARLKLDKKKLT
jgi:hypothetical protein